ncbi:glycosyltransferase [Dyadobacter psychrotolerans]|uniref:Glycosyltransferase family 1 protein n=1 Tax=Dyadobacter psychrotolerans TaxID=2541721 RepID=A0A4R5DCY2_9BACT|nr:glycosyltransferase [Dyadobacter psychrotolerans]TDE11599.1 glycosyltransferase family 1 protein [Dyadobacter psychrotolerans]
MKAKNILIIGKIPPPIGGVTVHVARLLNDLKRKNFTDFSFYDLAKEPLWKVFPEMIRFPLIHLHTSNTYFQLIAAIFCLLTNRNLITTYHGNWRRFGFLRNLAGSISATLSFVPIALNPGSLHEMKKWNSRAVFISAFIRPGTLIPLPESILEKLHDYKRKYKLLFCTNATNLAFDRNGREIYGISDLVTRFSTIPGAALVVCDSSEKYIDVHLNHIPENILFLKGEHDFCNILWMSDGFIRNTTTDGDSISIREALHYGVTVFATDCVTRPAGCVLFKNIGETDFVEKLQMCSSEEFPPAYDYELYDATDKLIKLYRQCLNNCKI